jgi:hypothetical protein
MDRAAGESFTKETVSRSSLAAGELGSFKALGAWKRVSRKGATQFRADL